MNDAVDIVFDIKLTEQAEDDIDEILSYYLQISQELALTERIYDVIYQSIDGLAFMPMRCAKADFSPKLHKLITPKFPIIIYFTIDHHTVTVIHVLHGAQDLSKLQHII